MVGFRVLLSSSSCESSVWVGVFLQWQHSVVRSPLLGGSVLRGGRFMKGGQNGTGTLHRLRGMTNDGCRCPSGLLDSLSPVPIS